jgi:hypothetical protein
MTRFQNFLLVIIIILAAFLTTQKYWVSPLVAFILQHTNGAVYQNNPLDTSYIINGKEIILVHGKSMKIRIFGEPVYGDLNGDDVDDAAVFIEEDMASGRTFFYIAEAINFVGYYRGTSALFLGDRIAPQNINIIKGQAVANFAVENVGKSVYVNLDAKQMLLSE